MLLIAPILPINKLIVHLSPAAESSGTFSLSALMILIEPTENYERRWAEHYRRAQEVLRTPPKYEDSWDEWIIGYLRSTGDSPIRFMQVVNALARTSGARSKRQREQVKIAVMKRLGALIRGRLVRRWKRKLVRLPSACPPTNPP